LRHQRKGYWCGIASIANALEVLGIRRTQCEIAKLCDVTPTDGTNETEMKRALLANGVGVDEWSHEGSDGSLWWVDHCLVNGRPVILCVDSDEHWVTLIGLCGTKYLLFDPSRNTGIEVHTPPSLAARWVNAEGIYYGIGVSTP
jgi:ABC-type bacteriocin/lantibiotic exporter with double-glycine peptidase domain